MMDVWSTFERRYKGNLDLSDVRTIEESYRSRVRKERLARRKRKKSDRLYDIYDRLSALPDATEFITRDLFIAYKLPEKMRLQYIRTHKVVGPEAGLVRSYAVIFKTAEELTGPLNVQVRANRGMIIPLAMVLMDPAIAQSMLSIPEILQVRREAVVDPSNAAAMAQTFLRRRNCGTEVVVVGELNRSRNECAKTLERFSECVGRYNEPIETVMEGNWIQAFGPNGIRDWSISMHLSRVRTLKAVYELIMYMGCDVVRLLFENELSILSAVLVDYGDNISEPIMHWTPCAASDEDRSGTSDDSGREGHSPVVGLSTDLMFEGEMETISIMKSTSKAIFETRKRSIVSVTSGNDKQYGNAVELSSNCLLTCTHVLTKVCPGSTNPLKDNNISDELALLSTTESFEGAWSVRHPVIGELCTYLFVENNEVHFTAPTVILKIDSGFVTTSGNSFMGKGRSGCALVSLTDVALLGVFTATYCDLLISVAVNPEVRRSILDLVGSRIPRNLDSSDHGFSKVGLDHVYERILSSTFLEIENSVYLNSPFGLVNCGPYIPHGDRLCPIEFGNMVPSDITCRSPVISEPCFAITSVDGNISSSLYFPFGNLPVEKKLSFDSGYTRGSLVAIFSCIDCSLIKIAEIDENGLLEYCDYNFSVPYTINAFDNDTDWFLDEVCGKSWSIDTRSKFLGYLTDLSIDKPYEISLTSIPVDKLVMDVIESISSDRLQAYCVWLSADFYITLVGEMIILKNFEVFCSEEQIKNFKTIHEKFLFLLYKFFFCVLGEDVYNCLVLHLHIKFELEPA